MLKSTKSGAPLAAERLVPVLLVASLAAEGKQNVDHGGRDHGDRLFEVNSTNSFKNLSP